MFWSYRVARRWVVSLPAYLAFGMRVADTATPLLLRRNGVRYRRQGFDNSTAVSVRDSHGVFAVSWDLDV
ncbi:hypothetical protein C1Y40_04056 [Mycobacterium talmoniae]|uniref:Uncharacterized protein n=1 Tax=Mycobacterium talmoniae TaxID=1858794 RepID=A0A2S8BGI0_9MYCO|nr:hypothetical protein C1Y40_04056 [Mycobacterium talmoniae]